MYAQSFKLYKFIFKALSALSSQAANLSSKLEAALKQQEQFFKKTVKQHSSKVSKTLCNYLFKSFNLINRYDNVAQDRLIGLGVSMSDY